MSQGFSCTTADVLAFACRRLASVTAGNVCPVRCRHFWALRFSVETKLRLLGPDERANGNESDTAQLIYERSKSGCPDMLQSAGSPK
jgi:hypothetical protein